MAGQGPAELVLIAAVARRHYLQDRSKVEIAEELGISRFKVARLLDAAREMGLVRIEIVRQGTLDLDVSAQLQERFGLTHAVVVDTPDRDATTVRQQLGEAAAHLVEEVVTADDVLGLPWSRNVYAVVSALNRLAPAEVVQLSGAIALPDFDSSAVDIVRRAARLSGGRSHVFYAPFVLDDAASADAVRRQPPVAEGLARARSVTVAIVGVGQWAPGESTIHDLLSAAEQAELAELGVIGEVAGVFFDRDGKVCRPSVADRLVTVDEDALCGIPEVVAVVSGAAKEEAVRAALRGGLVQSLVTDAELARALLARS
ncbi:transcriptional regulator [Pedococcus cremeus]|uniref:Transcriptional regulator n=1 Tax=Pedococcus cremeus TaxID=587636 RepID=A0A1H9VYI6_9MICO|nr:sugar-binding domain-containing protein [Pedococcus cremeus]SES26830.1 transcriptional regulator [Pedococcus cremeus]